MSAISLDQNVLKKQLMTMADFRYQNNDTSPPGALKAVYWMLPLVMIGLMNVLTSSHMALLRTNYLE